MKLKEKDDGVIATLKLYETYARSIKYSLFLMIFLGPPAYVLGLVYTQDPISPITLGIIFVLWLFIFLLVRLTAEEGYAEINRENNTITVKKKGFIKSKITFPITPEDKIILKREYENKYYSSSGNRSARSLRIHLTSLREEKEAIINHTLNFDGYLAEVPREDLTPEEKERIRQIDDELIYRQDSTDKILREEWDIYFQPNNSPELVYMVNKTSSFNPNYNEFVERVAEIAHIKMVDHTGIYPEIIQAGETDVDIASRVRAANVKPMTLEDMQLRQTHFKYIPTENGLRLEGISDKITFTDFFKFMFGTIFIIVNLRFTIDLIRIFMSGSLSDPDESFKFMLSTILLFTIGYPLSYWGFRMINGIMIRDIIELNNSDKSLSYTRRKVFTRKKKSLNLEDVERVLVVKKGDDYTIELVTDKLRMTFGSGYSLTDAKKLRDVIVSNLQ